MSNPLSESEKTVISAYFRDPRISLENILDLLEQTRQKVFNDADERIRDKRFKKKVDVRSISKFKSLGLKKILKGLNMQSNLLNLDKTIQPLDNDIENLSQRDIEILKKNLGILIGFDYRLNTQVYVIYTIKKGYFVWYEHECNERCKKQCYELLNLLKIEHGISLSNKTKEKPFLIQFRVIVELIAKGGYNNE